MLQSSFGCSSETLLTSSDFGMSVCNESNGSILKMHGSQAETYFKSINSVFEYRMNWKNFLKSTTETKQIKTRKGINYEVVGKLEDV